MAQLIPSKQGRLVDGPPVLHKMRLDMDRMGINPIKAQERLLDGLRA